MMVVSANFFSYVTSYYSGSIVRYIRRYIYQWLHYAKDFKYRFWLLSLRLAAFLSLRSLKNVNLVHKTSHNKQRIGVGQKPKLAPVLRSCVKTGGN